LLWVVSGSFSVEVTEYLSLLIVWYGDGGHFGVLTSACLSWPCRTVLRHRLSQRWRSAMAKLNVNTVLCNVSANDVVVAGRMGIGAHLAALRAAALLSQGCPAHAGPESTPATREVRASVVRDDRDAARARTGRSETRPYAGGFVTPRSCHLGRTAIASRWQLAKQEGFKKSLKLASAMGMTSGR
jgi:hypothetical protein